MSEPVCRFCATPLHQSFADLGATPLANSYLDPAKAHEPEPVYPLHARVCSRCRLVQVEALAIPEEVFGHYAYFSSYATSWVEHARRYAMGAISRWSLSPASRVVEVASNDGYLLQHFVAQGISVLGIEPAANVAEAARAKGVPTEVAFMGRATAQRLVSEGIASDLIAANNVLAHVPDIKDFVAGLKTILKPSGVMSIEFPHLLRLIEGVQFDTIYHEHYSYLSLLAVERIAASQGLRVFDVEELPTHGGSLRVWFCHADRADLPETGGLHKVRADEAAAGFDTDAAYTGFQPRIEAVRDGLLRFLHEAKSVGRVVAAYGAAAKGNTLLNYCGVGPDLVRFVVDRNPHKQGCLLPGSRIPIHAPERIAKIKPDYVLILPWNLKDEIAAQMSEIRAWGGKFVTAVPEIAVW
jgi:2-polyprenyl-3-methyl-5-hydroxy-6-metoxy-1,4-benzoquinol methylase